MPRRPTIPRRRPAADPFADATRLHIDGRAWPAGQPRMTLDEIEDALAAITPETCKAAQQSLNALLDDDGRP